MKYAETRPFEIANTAACTICDRAMLGCTQSTKTAFDDAMPRDPFIREKFTKRHNAARKLAAEYFERFPKDRYQTEVESWRKLQSDNIEFTMKRSSIVVRPIFAMFKSGSKSL